MLRKGTNKSKQKSTQHKCLFVDVSENAALYYTCTCVHLEMKSVGGVNKYACHLNILDAGYLSGIVRSCPFNMYVL